MSIKRSWVLPVLMFSLGAIVGSGLTTGCGKSAGNPSAAKAGASASPGKTATGQATHVYAGTRK